MRVGGREGGKGGSDVVWHQGARNCQSERGERGRDHGRGWHHSLRREASAEVRAGPPSPTTRQKPEELIKMEGDGAEVFTGC